MMKYTLLLVLFLSPAASAQKACEQWFPYGVGEGFKLEARDKDGTASGYIRFTVMDISRGGERIVYTVKRDIHDYATNGGTSVEYTMECDDDKMYIDTRTFYFPSRRAELEGMKTEMESENLAMPATLQVGDELPEAGLTMRMKMGETVFMTMALKFARKKVTGREPVAVPAGTFSCLKIEGETNIEMKVMNEPTNFTTKTVQWYAQGIGMVKEESYDESGGLSGTVVLAERF